MDARSETMAGETNDLAVATAIRRGAECPMYARPQPFAVKTRLWNSPRHSLYNAVVLRSHRSAAARPRLGDSRMRTWGFLLFLVALAPAMAAAAPPAAPASGSGEKAAKTPVKAPAKPAPAPTGSGGSGNKKVISLDDEFLVEGQLEKPSAFYVLRRSSTDYDWARLDATMTPLVLESVWDPLF
jgi:hypothetical protein